jgi:hypothetical protein
MRQAAPIVKGTQAVGATARKETLPRMIRKGELLVAATFRILP